ncbi:MAG: (Fe-S)-binding protein [Candidatus Eremiobacteraeota bacterium]|nr:(Fe-S)-binding protein [Candidatus Eremiobacteraeota bacterium]
MKNKNKNFYSLYHDFKKCLKCGTCLSVCPIYQEGKLETESPRGKMALLESASEGDISAAQKFRKVILYCLGCNRCAVVCPNQIPTNFLFYKARAILAEQMGVPILQKFLFSIFFPSHRLMSISAFFGNLMGKIPLENIIDKIFGETQPAIMANFFRAYSYPSFMKSFKQKNENENEKVGFFVGCMDNYFFPGSARAIVEVLENMGYQVVVPPDQSCCGAPLLSLGLFDEARSLARNTIRAFKSQGINKIITGCATCADIIKHWFPELLGKQGEDFADRIYDLVGFINQSDRPVPFSEKIKGRVLFHVPCHLGQGLGLADEAFELLDSLPGISLVQPEGNDMCCGFGGIFTFDHPEISGILRDKRVKSILDAEPDIVVTACPACRWQIDEGLKKAGSALRTIHLADLLVKKSSVPEGKSTGYDE